jgi:hypothetical protein
MRHQLTDTEEALEDEYGVETTLPYSLRADQLTDGTYRYALENPDTGETLAEGIHADEHEALARFRRSLADSSLSTEEVEALQQAVRHYDRSAA